MRRRYAFPLVLLGATGLWSLMTGLVSSPTQSYDYLDALAVDERYALGTVWEDSNIPHADTLADADKDLFMRMVEELDNPSKTGFKRSIFIDQAAKVYNENHCTPKARVCTYNVYLNRTVRPNYIHGDLRLVSLDASSLRQQITLFPKEQRVEYGATYNESRQLRFMLTERGWVFKSSEITGLASLKPVEAFALETPKMSGLNYYPRSAPWDEFWDVFPQEDIAADLDGINQLRANSVRIFLEHDYFANLDTQKDGLEKLGRFMKMCEARNLKVIVTLFDLRGDYRFQNWSRDSVHISKVLNAISDHPALLAVDLKNQADLDFKTAGKANVLAWAEAMIASVRDVYPDVALTIGWSDAQHADQLSGQLNLISFHDYQEPRGLSKRLKTVREQAAGKPVFVTEIGHSRWHLIGEGTKAQARDLSKQLEAVKSADGVFVWTLHDFDYIGSNIVGHRPWRKAQQKAYGIIKANGELRPAAHNFQSFNSNFIKPPQTGE